MLILEEQERVMKVARSLIETQYDRADFNCRHFVEKVFKDAELEISYVRFEEYGSLNEQHMGQVLLLVRRSVKHLRPISHMGIFSDHGLLHCSYYFGRAVVETSLEELFEVYDLSSWPE